MPVYEIIPNTTAPGYNITPSISNTSSGECRKLCDVEDDCVGFIWSEAPAGDDKSPRHNGVCTLKRSISDVRAYDPQSILHIKKGNPSYIWFWVFLGIMGVIVFLIMCKGMRRD